MIFLCRNFPKIGLIISLSDKFNKINITEVEISLLFHSKKFKIKINSSLAFRTSRHSVYGYFEMALATKFELYF